MSDAGRKPFADKVSETVKPDSEKSYLEQGKEAVTDTIDSFAGKNVPDSEKSFGQSVADHAKQGKDDAQKEIEGQSSSISETAQEYYEAAKEKASEAAEYVSNVVSGATEGAQDAADSATKK
ncbi:hypothetical protein FT663_02099 [Candidozyma haemuli var. vulneris]|uniref:12 kDa heat shock protein n=1 Tax=Candidozyma haemuli TaxID=45357 RepID=A0A2V1AQJ4_9ASCO|nr:hypothetical protein CXQ85_001929 [[Candida] haemuloni]KAF3988665.1 hypothetical protein FT662_03269 [[Candida] haemuloni var. vulneris]KAF3992940.1 hypothetical protein FT663_02099 [[Candida] haemuloni var. vulneris]PVH20149.1 hypothetical protein CXQ85_001929 [[Candida] haemuloni]